MTKLSDTQAILLSAAAQRADGNLLPLPGSLRGGAAAKVVGALIACGFAREEVTDLTTRADTALNTIWRNEDDGRAVFLKNTPEGLAAIGVEPPAEAATALETRPAEAEVDYPIDESADSAAEPATATPAKPVATRKRGRPKKAAATHAAAAVPVQRKTRDHTKQALLIAMLRRKEGATIAQIVEATGWQPHTVRGAFAGALKKKLGLTVTSEKLDGGDRVYRIA